MRLDRRLELFLVALVRRLQPQQLVVAQIERALVLVPLDLVDVANR